MNKTKFKLDETEYTIVTFDIVGNPSFDEAQLKSENKFILFMKCMWTIFKLSTFIMYSSIRYIIRQLRKRNCQL